MSLAEKNKLSSIQLHGDETVELARNLKSISLSIIKVFSIDDDFDFNICKPWIGVSDYFLFDTKGESRGGNGKPFNWNVLGKYQESVPFLLSGGLSLLNIHEALKIKHPKLIGFDVNSGVELEPGIKNIKLVNQFINTLNIEK